MKILDLILKLNMKLKQFSFNEKVLTVEDDREVKKREREIWRIDLKPGRNKLVGREKKEGRWCTGVWMNMPVHCVMTNIDGLWQTNNAFNENLERLSRILFLFVYFIYFHCLQFALIRLVDLLQFVTSLSNIIQCFLNY